MKTAKLISLSLLALGLCSLAVATEYKTPEVGFKKRTVPSKEVKTYEFGDHYRVEGAVTNDRQIASEDEASDREPSSVKAYEKKKAEWVQEEKKDEDSHVPKPWLYRTESTRNN